MTKLFDPKVAKLARTFADEPAVPVDALFALDDTEKSVEKSVQASSDFSGAVRMAFEAPKPWQPETLFNEFRATGKVTEAAVLVPVCRLQGDARLHVLLTQRPVGMNSHAGQIAFPGGKVDADDASIPAAALREAHEEIGLQPSRVQVLGTLPTYATGSGFRIHPVLAWVEQAVVLEDLTLNPSEVDAAFAVPLQALLQPAAHQLMEFEWRDEVKRWFAMPVVDSDGVERYVWGATAGMLRNMYRFLAAQLL